MFQSAHDAVTGLPATQMEQSSQSPMSNSLPCSPAQVEQLAPFAFGGFVGTEISRTGSLQHFPTTAGMSGLDHHGLVDSEVSSSQVGHFAPTGFQGHAFEPMSSSPSAWSPMFQSAH